MTTGVCWNLVSSTQAVVKGNSDRQNSSARLAHRTPPLTRRTRWNMWWWLFQ